MYNAKFLLLATPAYALLLGRAMAFPSWRGWRRWLAWAWGAAALSFVVAASFSPLYAYYYDPRHARDDYRGIARYIEAVEGDADAVLINAPGQYETFICYYRGRSPLHPLPRQRPIDVAVTEQDLRQMITGKRHVYAILWATDESDPGRFIEGWLDQHAYKASDTWYGNVRLAAYALPREVSAETKPRLLEALFGERIALRGYALLTPEVAAGEIVQIALFWEALAPVDKRYKVFVHILDSHEHIVGQRDAEPGGGAKITTTWQPSERVVDNHGVLVLPGVPPGSYRLALGLYGLDDGKRLPIAVGGVEIGDRLFLDPVIVHKPAAPPPQAALDMQYETQITAGPLRLWGYNLSKLGQEHIPDAPVHPGDVLHLTLFWRATAHPPADLEWLIQVVDAKGAVRLAVRSQPSEGDYPTSRWQAGEVVRDQHLLVLPSDLPPGRYRLLIGVYQLPSGTEILPPRQLGQVTVR